MRESRGETTRHGPTVFLAEDDPELLSLLASVLESEGYEVRRLLDGATLDAALWASDRSARSSVALVVTDVRMPGFSGLDVLEELRRAGRAQPVILITAFGDQALHDRARELGATAVLNKPFELEELVEAVRCAAPLPPVWWGEGGEPEARR